MFAGRTVTPAASDRRLRINVFGLLAGGVGGEHAAGGKGQTRPSYMTGDKAKSILVPVSDEGRGRREEEIPQRPQLGPVAPQPGPQLPAAVSPPEPEFRVTVPGLFQYKSFAVSQSHGLLSRWPPRR